MADAQYILGLVHTLGGDAERDLVTAFAWMILASENGNEAARGRMPALQAEMTAGQLVDAQKLAVTLSRAGP